MSNQIFTVAKKEIKDNLRDRKTVMSSIFMGAVFMPVLFVVLMNFITNMQKIKLKLN